MAYDPLDADGFQQIEGGDRVYVWGELDLDQGEATRFEASGVVSLTMDEGEGDHGRAVDQGVY